jgi:hypothetical protein
VFRSIFRHIAYRRGGGRRSREQEVKTDTKMLYANHKNIELKYKRIFDGQGNCRLRRFMASIA